MHVDDRLHIAIEDEHFTPVRQRVGFLRDVFEAADDQVVLRAGLDGVPWIALRGKFQDSHTEIIDYKDINKLVLSGFNAPPVSSTGNQKGKITVVKKNGVSVPLEEAELALSCFSPSDKYNEIHVQILNPLTEKAVDLAIEMRKIESVSF
jgi:hypothetical protein